MEGFQLWLNLRGKPTSCATPWYRDIQSDSIPEVTTAQGVQVRVIAGQSHGTAGAMQREHTAPLYLDLHFPEGGGTFSQPLPATHNAFVYTYRGTVAVSDAAGTTQPVALHRMAILANEGDGVSLHGSGCRTGPAHCRAAAARAHCPVRPVCHEHARTADPGSG
jgi:redox-sensitive bicupin YhaK (pirin superfamily)